MRSVTPNKNGRLAKRRPKCICHLRLREPWPPIPLIAVCLVGRSCCAVHLAAVGLAARPANRPAQELGLLMLLLREAIAPLLNRLTFGDRLLANRLNGIGIAVSHLRGSMLLTPAKIASLAAVWTIATVPTITAVATISPVLVPIAVVPIAIAETALPLEALTVLTLVVVAYVRLLRVPRVLERRLHIAIIALVVPLLVAVVVEGAKACNAAVHVRAALADLLFAEGHDDAVVMLGMLQVVLCQDRIA